MIAFASDTSLERFVISFNDHYVCILCLRTNNVSLSTILLFMKENANLELLFVICSDPSLHPFFSLFITVFFLCYLLGVLFFFFFVCLPWFPQVTYSVAGFTDKNSERLCPLLTAVLYRSGNELMRNLFPEGNPKISLSQQPKRPASLSSHYKISTAALVKNIQSRKLNFIKCMKPNEIKAPSIFVVGLVQHQIRYLLLSEAARLFGEGYAFAQPYEPFLRRFKIMSKHTWPSWPGLPAEGVALLLKGLPFLFPEEFFFGRTKIFIHSLKNLTDLETNRSEKLNEQACLLQKIWRGWTAKQRYQGMIQGQRIIRFNWKAWKIRRFLRRLARHLPSDSPLDQSWPESPFFLRNTSLLLRKLHHRWRVSCFSFSRSLRTNMSSCSILSHFSNAVSEVSNAI